MTFLQLCQRAATECGVASGSAIGAVLPTVAGANGSLARVVNWVGDAWTDIQSAHEDWQFMRSSNILGRGVSFQTVAGQASYPLGIGLGTVGIAVDDFGEWDLEAFRDQTTNVGYRNEWFLDNIPYDTWRNSYMLGAMRSVQTRPVAIAVGPDRSLCLGPPPDAEYTITGDYIVAPQIMALDTDVPLGLPLRFHMLIVYVAMIKYGSYESAGEVSERGMTEKSRMMANLLSARAPRMVFGSTLA